MTDLKVKYEDLKELAKEMNSVKCRLEEVDDKDDFSPSVFGDGILLEAVRKFSHGWRDGRKQVTEGLETLGKGLEEYAGEIEEYDKCFNDSANGSTSGAQPDAQKSVEPAVPGTVPTQSSGTSKPLESTTSRVVLPPVPGRPPGLSGSGSPTASTGPTRTTANPVPFANPTSPTANQANPPTGLGGPITSPVPPQVGEAISQIDERTVAIDQELGWIDHQLDTGGGDAGWLISQRKELVAERERIQRLKHLLGEAYRPSDDPIQQSQRPATEPYGSSTGASTDSVPVSTPSPVTNVAFDGSDQGHLIVTIGDPATAKATVIYLGPAESSWEQVLDGSRPGHAEAWKVFQQAPVGDAAVVSYFDNSSEPGAGAAVQAKQAGQRLSATAAALGSATAPVYVVDEQGASTVREAARAGSPMGGVAVVGGTDQTVADLTSRGIAAVAIEANGSVASGLTSAASASPGSTQETTPLDRIVEWIKNLVGGENDGE